MPMYCVPFSIRTRTTPRTALRRAAPTPTIRHGFAGPRSQRWSRLRRKGAIIYAQANTTSSNGRVPSSQRQNFDKTCRRRWLPAQQLAGIRATRMTRRVRLRSAQARLRRLGQHEPRDVRAVRGTGQSCRGARTTTRWALILPQKRICSSSGGAIGAEIYNEPPPGFTAASVVDAARVIDALKKPGQRILQIRAHLHTVAALEPADRAL